MAQQLAHSGVRTPVVVTAGSCSGDALWKAICNAIADPVVDNKTAVGFSVSESKATTDTNEISKQLLEDLLSSGCLDVIVDGRCLRCSGCA
jgi:hypothetical protein